MALGTLREKQLVRIAGHIFRLDTKLPNGEWCMTELATGLVDSKPENALWSAYEAGTLKFENQAAEPANNDLRGWVQGLSEAASFGPAAPAHADVAGGAGALRLRYVRAIEGKARAAATQAILSVWNELKRPTTPPGYSTVMRWKARANGQPDPVRALRDHHDRKGRRGHRYAAEVLAILREVRDSHYLCSNPRISATKAAEIARDQIRLRNACRLKSEHLALPKRKAMLAIIHELDAEEVLAARFGADKAMQMLRVNLGGIRTTRPLERVEIDHTVLSIILLDDDFEPIGRAFITAAKDAFTRSVVGFYWGAENPSVVSLARCLRHALQPKLEFLKGYPNVKNDWPCFGAAESWVIDNGHEEHAAALQQAGSEGGVQRIEYCARLSPWQKPNIERYFRTQDQAFIHGLPGTTMENIAQRSNFNPKKDMLMRWSTFDKLIVKWVVDVYMQKPQRILKNRSPYQMWVSHKGTFTQYVPDSTTVLESLFLRQVDDRTLDHEGVEFDRLIYNSLDMKIIRRKFGCKLKTNIRVNDEDLSYIYVQVPDHDIWVKVPCLDLEYSADLTRWQHKKCKKMQSICADDGVELSLAEARQQILDDIDAEKATVTQGRKKARARLRERSQKSHPVSADKSRLPESPMPNEAGDEDQTHGAPGPVPQLDVDYFERRHA